MIKAVTSILRLVVVLALAAWLPVAGPAGAQAAFQRGLPATLSPAGRGWMAVGRLDLAGQDSAGFCTVSLIAEDRALTAAHCVLDEDTGRARPLDEMQIRLGFQNGRAEASRTVRRIQLAQGAAARHGATGGEASLVPVDLAVLWLDSPVRLPQVAPLSPLRPTEDGPEVGAVLTVVSYARGRSEVAGLQEDCRLLARRPDGSLILNCEIDSGASGSPVIARVGGALRVVAVVSAMAESQRPGGGQVRVALAAPLTGAAARGLLDGDTAAPPQGAAGVRIRRPEVAQDGQGARFLRP